MDLSCCEFGTVQFWFRGFQDEIINRATISIKSDKNCTNVQNGLALNWWHKRIFFTAAKMFWLNFSHSHILPDEGSFCYMYLQKRSHIHFFALSLSIPRRIFIFFMFLTCVNLFGHIFLLHINVVCSHFYITSRFISAFLDRKNETFLYTKLANLSLFLSMLLSDCR